MSAAGTIRTRIWSEEGEVGDPFATRAAYCRGYDVFGAMVGSARWVEMMFLLFRDELPDGEALDLLEALAVALANPGPRDPSVHAAMSSGATGATAASALIAALAVAAGRAGGGRDVFDAMVRWEACGADFAAWSADDGGVQELEVWPEREHPPGFDSREGATATTVLQLLDRLAVIGAPPRLSWLARRRGTLEAAAGRPLAISGVAAAAFADLGFRPAEGEMLYLLLRLPGAAAHALEQGAYGFKGFPFPTVELHDDPARRAAP